MIQITKRAILFLLVTFVAHHRHYTAKAFTATTNNILTFPRTRGGHPFSPPVQQASCRRRRRQNTNINTNNLQTLTGKYYTTRSIAKLHAKTQESSLVDSFVSTVVGQTKSERTRIQLVTLLRVGVPSIISGIAAFFAFPALALFLASIVNDAGVFAVLSQDSSQFVQNFLTVSGLLFSILIGQTYAFLYTQQEAVFYALFNEVTEAKSLLEQVALVCQGRSMYGRVLESICKYVQNDLKQLKADPAVLISARPIDDPLEAIMYLTSVGVPSSVYETVRSLRQARAARLGALQRKLPKVHFVLLWILALIELVSFPLLGAGTQTLGGYNILTVEGILFGIMTFGIVVTMRVIGELYRPGGGAYNVDGVLSIMIKGLELELKERMAGGRRQVSNEMPSLPNDVYNGSDCDGNDLSMMTSGPSISNKTLKRIAMKPLALFSSKQ
mmetsp:Transcript_4579/g.8832  ORF Transcript_4579/g.8832 Transcript_4579/m.8832 type:complete len:442 (-) Transcript_4579:44-1369(-)|eukprot:CAMPEP_0176498064 /NCGR_PEP_ID=MMETSP0200_2-20121128/12096_1 /TAXON_ID=947934 /ORGANISM="Chaetoceros sp., Strain GSL56" /LENGTH=441 /DNA_ID=CAMNT_0017896195 /DNA_START=164 /DNA_END=1489 /DNA_ORIENTATION=+